MNIVDLDSWNLDRDKNTKLKIKDNTLIGVSSFGSPSNDYTITIQLLQKCSFSCSYCEVDYEKPLDKIKIDKYLDIITTIKNCINKNIRINIVGGDPLLHPQLSNLVNSLSSIVNKENITVITNISRTFNSILTISKKIPDIRIHGFFHLQQSDLTIFLQKAEILSLQNQLAGLTFVLNLNKSNSPLPLYATVAHYELAKSLFSTNINILPILEEEDLNKIDFNIILDKLDKSLVDKISYISNNEVKSTNKLDLVKAGGNNFKGFICYANSCQLIINNDGKCYSCRDVASIFNIKDVDLGVIPEVLASSTLCSCDYCLDGIPFLKEKR